MFDQLTILMYYNKSASIILYNNEPLLSSCGNTIWPWLFIHLCYIWLISCVFFFHLAAILVLVWIEIGSWYRWSELEAELFIYVDRGPKLVRWCRYARYEIRLIFIYVSLAFVFALVMNHRTISWTTIVRWCIEASWTPHVILVVASTYFNLCNEYLFDFDHYLTASIIYMIKGSLFLWMRYSELYPSSKLNDYQTFFFYAFCNKAGLHQLPDDYHLGEWIDASKELNFTLS